MADDSSHPPIGSKAWWANGGGTVSWRIVSTALAMILLGMVKYEAGEISARLDRIEAAQTANAQAWANSNARVDVHAARLDHLDTATNGLWAAVHANATLLNDHEHRISLLEGARSR